MKPTLLCSLLVFAASTLVAQAPAEEQLSPEQTTQMLKEEWIFLHEQIDEFIKLTETRGEFETQPEFEVRVARERSAFVGRVNAHIEEKHLDKRLFSTTLKASLVRYHIDSSYYSVTAPVPIEAPYDIPQLVTQVPNNPYVGIADTTQRGFRRSNIYLKFKPEFRWMASREVARAAHDDSTNISFRIKFILGLSQETGGMPAVLRIIPREVSLVNNARKTVYWKEDIK